VAGLRRLRRPRRAVGPVQSADERARRTGSRHQGRCGGQRPTARSVGSPTRE